MITIGTIQLIAGITCIILWIWCAHVFGYRQGYIRGFDKCYKDNKVLPVAEIVSEHQKNMCEKCRQRLRECNYLPCITAGDLDTVQKQMEEFFKSKESEW